MKVIKMNTPDGQYTLPLEKVAEHRADYYATEKLGHEKNSEPYKREVAWIMADDYEGIDWIINNSDYEDWELETTKLNNDVMVTMDDFWSSSDDFEIIDL